MVKLFSLHIVKHRPRQHPIELAHSYNLDDIPFFGRNSIKQLLKFNVDVVLERTGEESIRESVRLEEDRFILHIYISPSMLTACAVTDADYPNRVVFDLLKEGVSCFEAKYPDTWKTHESEKGLPFPEGKDLLNKYLNPLDVDKIARVQAGLDETKVILERTITSILDRGERIEDLVQRSEKLNDQSRDFYKRAKRNNQCCNMGG